MSKKILNLNEEDISSSGYVIDTLEACLWCLFNTDNYKNSVLKAVNLGNDADTIAAITGSISGLYYGINDIPKKWIDKIINKEMIDDLLDKYIKVVD